MNCKQCNNQYNNFRNIPQLLPRCGHTVCSECLQSDFDSGRFRCYECNILNFAEIVEDFPKNQTILDYNSPLKSIKGFSDQTKKNNQRNNISEHLSSFKDDASNFGKFGVNFFSVDNFDDKCLFHKKPFEAFCMDEKTLLCVQCLIDKTHHSHKVSDIPKAYEKAKNLVFKKMEELDNKNEFISIGFPAKLGETVQDLNHQYKHAVDKVELQFKELKDIIKKREKEILNQLRLDKK